MKVSLFQIAWIIQIISVVGLIVLSVVFLRRLFSETPHTEVPLRKHPRCGMIFAPLRKQRLHQIAFAYICLCFWSSINIFFFQRIALLPLHFFTLDYCRVWNCKAMIELLSSRVILYSFYYTRVRAIFANTPLQTTHLQDQVFKAAVVLWCVCGIPSLVVVSVLHTNIWHSPSGMEIMCLGVTFEPLHVKVCHTCKAQCVCARQAQSGYCLSSGSHRCSVDRILCISSCSRFKFGMFQTDKPILQWDFGHSASDTTEFTRWLFELHNRKTAFLFFNMQPDFCHGGPGNVFALA